jgi:hypothetical protein
MTNTDLEAKKQSALALVDELAGFQREMETAVGAAVDLKDAAQLVKCHAQCAELSAKIQQKMAELVKVTDALIAAAPSK